MTDKQIIVDGIDVSGCPYYMDSDGSCSSRDCELIKCVYNFCFYKAYKRKLQILKTIKELCNKSVINGKTFDDYETLGASNLAQDILQIIEDKENG